MGRVADTHALLSYPTCQSLPRGHGLGPGDHKRPLQSYESFSLTVVATDEAGSPTLGHHRAPGGGHRHVNDPTAPAACAHPMALSSTSEVLLSPGPTATCSPFLDPACFYILQPEAEGAPLRMQGN